MEKNCFMITMAFITHTKHRILSDLYCLNLLVFSFFKKIFKTINLKDEVKR
jgi:hypothetical protein